MLHEDHGERRAHSRGSQKLQNATAVLVCIQCAAEYESDPATDLADVVAAVRAVTSASNEALPQRTCDESEKRFTCHEHGSKAKPPAGRSVFRELLLARRSDGTRDSL